MGQEILYCSRCQTRLMGNDLERGTAIRVGNTVACKDCAPEVLLALPPEQRPQTPKPRKTSTGRIPIIRPPSGVSSRASARREEPPPPPKSNANVWIGVGVGGVALVLLLAMMSSGGSDRSRPRETESGPPRYLPDNSREESRSSSSSSSGTLDRVKKRIKDNPEDIDGNAAAALEAFKQLESGAQGSEARELRDVVLVLQRNAYAKEFAAVERDATIPADRGDFARATIVLEEARKRHATDDWASRINSKLAELKTREAATRPNPSPAPAPPPSPGTEKPWKALFDGKSADFLNPQSAVNWRLADGALEKIKEIGDAGQSKMDFSDGELRIRFEQSGLSSCYFKVRQGAGGYSATFGSAALVALEGKPHVLVFVMNGETVTATLDGQPVPIESDGALTTGRLQFNAQGRTMRILSIETR